LADSLGIEFFETSAKDATNVSNVFMTITAQIKARFHEQPIADAATQQILQPEPGHLQDASQNSSPSPPQQDTQSETLSQLDEGKESLIAETVPIHILVTQIETDD
jgi:hypothetical protein